MNEQSMDLLRAFGAVDEKIIEKTAPQEFSEASENESVTDKAPKERHIHKIIAGVVTFGSAAACIAVLSVLLPKLGDEKPSPGDPQQTTVTEVTTAPYTGISLNAAEITGTFTTETTVNTSTLTGEDEPKEGMDFKIVYNEESDTYGAYLSRVYLKSSSLVIPDEYYDPDTDKKYPVVGILNCFDNYHPQEITFPATMYDFNAYSLNKTPWMKNQLRDNGYVIVNGVLIGANPQDGILRVPDGVTMIAECAFDKDLASDHTVPRWLLKEVYIPASVKKISYCAFQNQPQLTTVHFSEGLEEIDLNAFCGCNSLSEMTLPKSLKKADAAFDDLIPWLREQKSPLFIGDCLLNGRFCTGDIVVPEGITKIDCYENENITSVVLPSTAENYSFYGCTNLSKIVIPENLRNIPCDVFMETPWLQKQKEKNPLVVINGCIVNTEGCKGDIVIPEGVTEMMPFTDNDEITSVSIPSTVKTICRDAFCNCTALKSVTISKGVEAIYPFAFYRCINLSDIKLPEGLLAIGERAFVGCRSLKEIRLPDGLKQIDEYAFSIPESDREGDNWKCSCISSVTIPDSLIYIGAGVFDGTSWMEQKRAENPLVVINNILIDGSQCKGDVVIPEGVTKIVDNAFSYNQEIVSVTLPDSLKQIGWCAFYGCSALKSVHLSEGLEEIGNCAFENCTALESFHLPDHAVSIGYDAFEDTKWIQELRNRKETMIAGGVLFNAKDVSGKYVIPENVHAIYGHAFENNTEVTEVVIPSTVKEFLGEYVFSGCNALKYVKIEEGMLDLPARCFTDCPLLERVELPYSLGTLGASFVNCPSIKEIWLSDRIDTVTDEYYWFMLEGLPDGIVIHRVAGTPGQWDMNDDGRYYFEEEDEGAGG